MSIAVLTEVYEETRRLAIAGSNLADDDFRLKKLVAPLEKAGEKAPVFGKVAEAIRRVVDSDTESAPGALLDLSSLVIAILYTQGKTGLDGDLHPIETTDYGVLTSTASFRTLSPVMEALTSRGSGRLETIKEAHERGAFEDLRLINPAISALDDPYPEVGDYVAENILPLYGPAIVPRVREGFKIKGKGGHVRRLILMHRLDPEGTRGLIDEALESGSKEMKIAAISCLKGSKGRLSTLLEQAAAKAKEVRQAALNAISSFTENEAVESLLSALKGKDLDIAAGPASRNPSPKLLKHLIEEAHDQLELILTTKDKEKRTKAATRFLGLLSAFVSRDDAESIAFLIECFEEREAIAKQTNNLEIDGSSINLMVACLMVRTNSEEAQRLLVNAHPSLEAEVLEWAMIAAVRVRTPKQVYDLFSPYYFAKIPWKQNESPELSKFNRIRDVLSLVAGEDEGGGGRHVVYYESHPQIADSALVEGAILDLRWLDGVVKTGDVDLAITLAQPNHKGVIKLFSKEMESSIGNKKGADRRMFELFPAMIRINHPKVVDHFLKALETLDRDPHRQYIEYTLAPLIPDLPKNAAPKIRAMIPKLNESTVDGIIRHLDELEKKEG